MTDINELMGSAFVRVKCVALIHFLFISNAMLGMWGHGAYEFYNFLFIIAMFWAMHSKDSIEAIQTALVINISSIVLDVVCIIMYAFAMNGWAITFSIINLLLRPLSCILLYREFNTRGGATGSVFPTTNTQQQRSYQDIDRPAQTLPTASTGPNVASIF